jgi:hypothetical protein
MYDDDDDHDDGGLGGAVWFQIGRWSAQREREIDQALDNLGNAFSFQPAQTLVYTHELNALVAQRNALQQQVSSLQRQLQKATKQITEDQDFALAKFQHYENQIDQIEYEKKVADDLLEAEDKRHRVTSEVKEFMTSSWFNMIKYVEYGLFNEPEFHELVQLTKQFYAGYSPARDTLSENTECYKRVYALTEVLDQRCKK